MVSIVVPLDSCFEFPPSLLLGEIYEPNKHFHPEVTFVHGVYHNNKKDTATLGTLLLFYHFNKSLIVKQFEM